MALVERRVGVADTAPSLRDSAESRRNLVVAPSRTFHPPTTPPGPHFGVRTLDPNVWSVIRKDCAFPRFGVRDQPTSFLRGSPPCSARRRVQVPWSKHTDSAHRRTGERAEQTRLSRPGFFWRERFQRHYLVTAERYYRVVLTPTVHSTPALNPLTELAFPPHMMPFCTTSSAGGKLGH